MANDLLERMRSGATRREAEERKQRAKARAAERVEQAKRNREAAARAKAEAETQRAEFAATQQAEAAERNRERARPKPTPVSAIEVELSRDDHSGRRMREHAKNFARVQNARLQGLLSRK